MARVCAHGPPGPGITLPTVDAAPAPTQSYPHPPAELCPFLSRGSRVGSREVRGAVPAAEQLVTLPVLPVAGGGVEYIDPGGVSPDAAVRHLDPLWASAGDTAPSEEPQTPCITTGPTCHWPLALTTQPLSDGPSQPSAPGGGAPGVH